MSFKNSMFSYFVNAWTANCNGRSPKMFIVWGSINVRLFGTALPMWGRKSRQEVGKRMPPTFYLISICGMRNDPLKPQRSCLCGLYSFVPGYLRYFSKGCLLC